MKKRAQEGPMGMSFGVIFAIFLIIVFIGAAIYGILHFLKTSECYQVGSFYENLQKKIDEVFVASSVEDEEFSIALPQGIEKVCFANLSAPVNDLESFELLSNFVFEDANIFLLPTEESCDMPYRKIVKINLEEIIKDRNPYCVNNGDKLKLNKKFYDKKVIIK